MHLFSLLITLQLFLLNQFTLASSNNPVKTITRLSINSGSTATFSAPTGREWLGDKRSQVQIKGSSTASTVTRSSISAYQVPYKTARISHSQFSYAFRVSPGEKILRLHFNSAPYKGFTSFNDLFNVEAGPFTLLTSFSASLTAAALGVNTFVKEFCLSVKDNQTLTITFSAVASQLEKSTYAFINGIEIIPVPLRLSYFKGEDHRLQVVGKMSPVYIHNRTALELIYRRNLEQDSDEFDDSAKENEINSLRWNKPVDVGFRYLVRIHLRDLGFNGASLKVLIDEMIVDAEVSIQRDEEYSVLKYRDYVVAVEGRKEEGKRDLSISLQPSGEFVDGDQLIKGFEILKLSNHDNNLASPNAFPPRIDLPPLVIGNLLQILLRQGNATLAIAILVLMNILFHMLREICEAISIAEEENRPSARAERFSRRFSLAEIQSATRDFSEALLIGRGGFGKVYMGLIDNGQECVAIKRLKSNSTQGRDEFLTEIETLSELRHNNLVSLIGYCNDCEEMILVYEYMPGGTLADQLHIYCREGHVSSSLTWKQRLDICIGSARGLEYLHTGLGVIHRDVKASNILLDENLVAKVSDFGLAKTEDRSKLASHVSTKVKGTNGYLDPYYYSTGKLTRMSDTYAFGVVMLEVLCEREAIDSKLGEEGCCLTRWVRNKIHEGQINEIVPSTLLEEIQPDSLKVFLEVAERCLHDEPKKRPTMAQIVVQLESALAQHESRKSTEQIIEQSAETYTNVQADASPPLEQTNLNYPAAGEDEWIKIKPYKPRLWGFDVFWNRFKPSKRKELTLTSEFCEAEIRLPKFEFSRLAAATDQFSSSHIIGQGDSACVYKGVLRTGRTVAVKRFNSSGRNLVNLFRKEINTVSRLHHRNIIKLVGYCFHEQRGILLYEFMENGGLDKFLDDEQGRRQLQWSQRVKVIIGIAKGVIYLHQESRATTIHMDLNPSNILLDSEMNPRISGFGLARNTEGRLSEHSTAIIAGGHLPPEYVATGRISRKIDVYSFGVLVLKILSCKRNEVDLLGCAWKLWIEGEMMNVLELVDKSVGGEYSEKEALRCIQVGLLCTQHGPRHRPTMASALKMLLGEEDLLLQEMMAEAKAQQGTS